MVQKFTTCFEVSSQIHVLVVLGLYNIKLLKVSVKSFSKTAGHSLLTNLRDPFYLCLVTTPIDVRCPPLSTFLVTIIPEDSSNFFNIIDLGDLIDS